MAKFVTILSGKGGVGKTTSAVNLGLALTKLGVDTIVLDGNMSSPNLSVHLGNTYFPTTIHDVMHKDEPIQNAIYNHNAGLKIIPADVSINSLRMVDFEKLRKHMQDLHLLTDYVIIDGSPGLGRETERLVHLSDEVLIITNPDRASVLDAKRLIDFVRALKKPITGVIVTKYEDKNHKLDLESMEHYLELPIMGVIPKDDKFEKSLHQKLPYIHLYPDKKAAKAYFQLANMLSGPLWK